MKLWLDQMLPGRLCGPMESATGCETRHVGSEFTVDLGIFRAAREEAAAVVTKDSDFVTLVGRLGVPPQVIWLRCGNRSNQELLRILVTALPDAIRLLEKGEPVVEIAAAIPRAD